LRGSLPKPGPVELRGALLCPLARDIRKALRPLRPPLGTGRLYLFAVIRLVATGEVLQSCKVSATIQNAQRDGVNFCHRNVEMAASLFYVANDNTRAIRTDLEFGIYRLQKRAELPRRHFAFGRDGQMPDAITTAFEAGERLGIVKRMPVAREDFYFFVLADLAEKVMSEIADTAFTGNTR